MAESRFKPITEDELASVVDRQIRQSVGFYDSKLSREREEVLDYYNGVKPKPLHAGNSKYVSLDVFDSVESMKAVLLETFSAGSRIVSFEPQAPDDVPLAQAATEYCDYVVFRQNDGYKVFSEVIQDGLMARAGVAKIYWDECIEEVQETFSNLTMEEAEILLAAPDVEDVEVELNEETGLYDGELTRTVNKSQVKIDVVPPEEFLITPQSKSIEEAPFIAHRTKKTFADLIREGYDRKLVEKIGAEDADELTMDPEVLARFEQVGADRLNMDGDVQEQTKYVILYECYLNLDMDGSGETKLYKIVKVGNVVLDKEEVDRKPFIAFVPLPVPHSFYGSNFAARVIPTQNARTVLVRGILDHTVVTNNPRYQVVKGALTNPKELIENRIGGLVNVTRPDGISPLMQPSLNPFVFQTIQLLDEDKEEATGVSRLSQGLNKDAVSKQNSQALVENLVSLSMQREKIVARNFANQFVKPLYLEIYRLAVANEQGEKVIKIAGTFQRMLPSEWNDRSDATVELKLGYGEQERESQKYLAMHQLLSADPSLAPMYGMDKKFNMLKTVFEKGGVKNVIDFLTPPEQIPPPQPDPMLMKQVELEERKVATLEKQADTTATKVQVNAELEAMRLEMQKMKEMFNQMMAERDSDRKEFDTTARYAIATEELQMAKDQMNNNPESARAIISPNP
jgi:hypothetical protein